MFDQFLHSNINTRTDSYGGSIEGRAKFLLELVDALAGEIGANNLAVRLEPACVYQGTRGEKRVETWSYICEQFAEKYSEGEKKLSYVHFIEPRFDRIDKEGEKEAFYKSWSAEKVDNEVFKGIVKAKDIPVLSCGGWSDANAHEAREKGWDGVVFAKWFASNPDLPER